MSTPEQLTLIRAAIHHRELHYADQQRELTDALIAMYADAERYQALELAHGKCELDVRTTDGLLGPRGKWLSYGGTLSGLADRLKNEGAK